MTDSSPTPRLILASQSPRRRELLALTGLPFDVITADIDETPHPAEPAAAYTLRLSREKAQAVAAQVPNGALVLAADTTVADTDAILGKPADPVEARAMLDQLRARTHQVYTALTVLDTRTGQAQSEIVCTDVHMRDYAPHEVEAYIASGDPFDKAGGYAIQNRAFAPVDRCDGCFSNVMGLPVCQVIDLLARFGLHASTDIGARCRSDHAHGDEQVRQLFAGA